MFYEDGHKYVNTRTGQRYMSVTQALSKLKPDVNWDYWAVYKYLEILGSVKPQSDKEHILYNGKRVHYKDHIEGGKEVRARWKNKSNTALAKGTFIHSYLENLFNRKVINVPDKYKNYIHGAYQFYLDNQDRQAIYPELIVADDDLMLAGQVDRPFFVEPGVIDIDDYKTDKEIKKDNQYGNLKAPADNLPDCNFSKYTLQLNTYRHIIEKNTDWKVRNLRIIHLTDTEYFEHKIPKYDMNTILNDVCRTHIESETCA